LVENFAAEKIFDFFFGKKRAPMFPALPVLILWHSIENSHCVQSFQNFGAHGFPLSRLPLEAQTSVAKQFYPRIIRHQYRGIFGKGASVERSHKVDDGINARFGKAYLTHG
jgi:hypothetical protein